MQTAIQQTLNPVDAHAQYRNALIKQRYRSGRSPSEIVREFHDVAPADIYALLGLHYSVTGMRGAE